MIIVSTRCILLLMITLIDLSNKFGIVVIQVYVYLIIIIIILSMFIIKKFYEPKHAFNDQSMLNCLSFLQLTWLKLFSYF